MRLQVVVMKSKEPLGNQIHIYSTDRMKEELVEASYYFGKSVSQMVREAIDFHLEEYRILKQLGDTDNE